jgi:Ca-activated chloride channel family protein
LAILNYLNVQFQYPQALWVLALVPFFAFLFLMYLLWKRKAARRIGDIKLVKELYKNHAPGKTILKFLLLMIAFSLGCIAVANPRKQDASTTEVRKGIDLVIALDVSNSMLATDVPPSRLQRAKAFILKLTEEMPDNRVGLVIFAGNAYLQMPLTFDHSAAQLFVSTAQPSAIAVQGTAIGEALDKCRLAFGEESGKYKAVVLITDGETHDENAAIAATQLAQSGVMINTVGIGSAEGSPIADTSGSSKKDASGNEIISKLNEPLLQQLATTTNGIYVHLENINAGAEQVLKQLAKIEKTALGDTSLFTYKTFFSWLALPMLLLLVIELFFPDRKKVKR